MQRSIFSSAICFSSSSSDVSKKGKDNKTPDSLEADNPNRRFLQCPGSVTVNHLKKFIITKYGLDEKFVVDVIYRDDLLAEDNSLIDVAYSYNWRKVKLSPSRPNSHLWLPPFPSNSFLLPPLDRHHKPQKPSRHFLFSVNKDFSASMVHPHPNHGKDPNPMSSRHIKEYVINLFFVADQSDAVLLQNLPKDKSADS